MSIDISKLTPATREICAELLPGGRSVNDLAVRYGVTPDAILKRRRRAEKKLGVILPRQHAVGRPIETQ